MNWDLVFFSIPGVLLIGIIIFRKCSEPDTQLKRSVVDGSYWGGYAGTKKQAHAKVMRLPRENPDRLLPPGPYQPFAPRPEGSSSLSDLGALHP